MESERPKGRVVAKAVLFHCLRVAILSPRRNGMRIRRCGTSTRTSCGPRRSARNHLSISAATTRATIVRAARRSIWLSESIFDARNFRSSWIGRDLHDFSKKSLKVTSLMDVSSVSGDKAPFARRDKYRMCSDVKDNVLSTGLSTCFHNKGDLVTPLVWRIVQYGPVRGLEMGRPGSRWSVP